MLLNLMLGASYYMQGTGFNTQYFYHIDTNTLGIAAQAYGGVFFPALLWLLLAFFAPLLFYRQKTQPRSGALLITVLWIGAIATSYPIYSLVNYGFGASDSKSTIMPQMPARVAADHKSYRSESTLNNEGETDDQPLSSATLSRKNIILIYAEGLEQLYFDQEVFGDLLPNIRELSTKAHRFTNVFQVPGTAWTIAGIVASQCGFPLVAGSHLSSNSTMASTERPFAAESCFADILRDHDYKTVYMGGAPLAFAGKGNFLRTHGYDQVLGKEELTPRLPDPDYNMGWGLHDDSLFDLALAELKTLASSDKPYLLTLLTLGTHHPSGYVSKSCSESGTPSDPMSRAIRCSDQLISNFIRKAMDMVEMDETVIVLFSDHLAMRNTLWDKLQENKDRRRLTWLIFDDQAPRSSDQAATHFDVAPTLLDMAGFSGNATLGQGSSLFRRQASVAGEPPPQVNLQQIPPPLISNASLKESGFAITYPDVAISISDFSVKANKNGWKFETGIFLLVFNESGHVTDTVYTDDFAQVIAELDGRFVVGVSIHGPTSVYEDQYFFGRLSKDLGSFTAKSLDSDVRVEAADFSF